MFEKITDKKFNAGKELTDEQAQKVFGGKVIATNMYFPDGRHFDLWFDNNDNFRYDLGDKFMVFISTAPPTPPDGDPVVTPYTIEQLKEMGVDVTIE